MSISDAAVEDDEADNQADNQAFEPSDSEDSEEVSPEDTEEISPEDAEASVPEQEHTKLYRTADNSRRLYLSLPQGGKPLIFL